MNLRTCVIGLIMAIVSYAAASQKASLTASADKQKILIGEPFHLNVKVTAPQGGTLPWFNIDSIPHFEILSKTKIDSAQNGNNIQLQQTYTITSWDSGRWQLPSLHLPTSGKTKPITIDVSFTPFDTTKDYNDVKDIIDTAPPSRTTWYWYVIGIALLFGLWMLLFFPQKKKKTENTTVPDAGAYKEALQQLEKLKKQLNTEQDAKAFYSALIDIFRTYLQRSRNIHSFSKTTDDLALQIKTLQLPADQYNSLVQTLQLSDFVKFARFQPGATENNTAFENIKKSIITIENLK